MPKRLPFTILPGQTEVVLNFLNSISNPSDITDNYKLKDDPSYDGSGGYTIGEKVAAKIINGREKLPRGKFRTIQQVLDIRGIGHDKVRDIMTSFWQPAAEHFHKRLFENVLLENWKVEYWTFDFLNEEDEFNRLTNSNILLRAFVAEKIRGIVQEKQKDYTLTNLVTALLEHLPFEKNETSIASSHLFALWWYRFDEDNWFSFERILEETTAYFNHYQRHDLQLGFFRGFVNGDTLAEAVTVRDLPVVINHAERRITIWAASLYD